MYSTHYTLQSKIPQDDEDSGSDPAQFNENASGKVIEPKQTTSVFKKS